MTLLRTFIGLALLLNCYTLGQPTVSQTKSRTHRAAARTRRQANPGNKPLPKTSRRSKPASEGTRAHTTVASSDVWRARSTYITLDEIGNGKGVVFSPDLSEPGNRAFYRALGFAYFEDPDWLVVLEQIKTHNLTRPRSRIETLLVLSHGTAGDALKLQSGNQPAAPRSYIAPAALQERLEGTGIRFLLLAACNAGRLFRPENYRTVVADAGNPLFEPPTLGITNASPDFNPANSSLTIARRAESHLEVINILKLSELSPEALAELAEGHEEELTESSHIAVPEMLIQLLLKDDQLRLVLWGAESQKSNTSTADQTRESLILRFLELVDSLASER